MRYNNKNVKYAEGACYVFNENGTLKGDQDITIAHYQIKTDDELVVIFMSAMEF